MSDSCSSDEFLELVASCQSRLFGYLYSLLHNMEDTEDVLQQTTLAMWRRFGEYDRSRNFFTWARQFAKFNALNHIRAKRRDRVVFSEELVVLMAETDDGGSGRTILRRLITTRWCDAWTGCPRPIAISWSCAISSGAVLRRRPRSWGVLRRACANSLRRIRLALFDCIAAGARSEDPS